MPKIKNPCVVLFETTILLPWLPLVSESGPSGRCPCASGQTTASIGARPCVPSDKHIWYSAVTSAELTITIAGCTRGGLDAREMPV